MGRENFVRLANSDRCCRRDLRPMIFPLRPRVSFRALPLLNAKPTTEVEAHLPSLDGKTVQSWRGILPSTHLAREGRMTVTIGRRELLAALGGGAAWPLAARAQQPTMRVIEFLGGADPGGYAVLVEAFRSALRDHGYIEGQNVRIEYRWAEGNYERLPGLAADLVRRKVDIIIT